MCLFTLHNYCASCSLDFLCHNLSLKVNFLFQSFLVVTVAYSFCVNSKMVERYIWIWFWYASNTVQSTQFIEITQDCMTIIGNWYERNWTKLNQIQIIINYRRQGTRDGRHFYIKNYLAYNIYNYKK